MLLVPTTQPVRFVTVTVLGTMRGRETDTETDRDRNRQKIVGAYKVTDRQTDREKERERGRDRERQRQRDRESQREREREIIGGVTWSDRQTGRQTDIDNFYFYLGHHKKKVTEETQLFRRRCFKGPTASDMQDFDLILKSVCTWLCVR